MPLRLLQALPALRLFHDQDNDWLYLDWQGELTLPAVQVACLAILRTYLSSCFRRVLNSNAQVTGVAWDVPAWLGQTLGWGLGLVGVEQLAWVYAPGLRGRDMAESVAGQLRHLNLALFADEEQAVTWLTHTSPIASAAPRPAAGQARLRQLLDAFERQLTLPA